MKNIPGERINDRKAVKSTIRISILDPFLEKRKEIYGNAFGKNENKNYFFISS